MFPGFLLDLQSPLELVGHLQVRNLHLSPPSPGSGRTSEGGTPQKAVPQSPSPVCGKGREVRVLLYRDSGAPFLQTVVLLSVLFWKSKISQGSEFYGGEWKFLFSRENNSAERFIFRRFISTSTFENLAKSYVITSKRYYFFYFRKSILTA